MSVNVFFHVGYFAFGWWSGIAMALLKSHDEKEMFGDGMSLEYKRRDLGVNEWTIRAAVYDSEDRFFCHFMHDEGNEHEPRRSGSAPTVVEIPLPLGEPALLKEQSR